MTEDIDDMADLDPLTFETRHDDEYGECTRFEASVHPADSDIESELEHARWIADNADEHVHPRQDEHVHVLAGTFRVAWDGESRTLTAGDEVVLPKGVPHRHWNPSDEPARVAMEHRPGLDSARLIETAFTLGQAGHVDETGAPRLLQMAVTANAHPDHFYPSDLPVTAFKILFKALAPIGRLTGCKPTYSRDQVGELLDGRR